MPDGSPGQACPGDPSGICDSTEGALLAGTGIRDITPPCFESWIDTNDDGEYQRSKGDSFLDCGCDRLCPDDPNYAAA